MSLEKGIVPACMKTAKVVPIYKSKQKDQFTNYRPISLLPTISKNLEKIIHQRIYGFIENILYNSQYGFRPNHSTINALTEFTSEILNSTENKLTSIAVYLDLSKAFDTLDYNILLRKLHHYGIRGIALDWFRSYLTDRKMYVDYKGITSKEHNINYGVPQGSVLGPLLFILYTNDLPNTLTVSKSILFADDTTIYYSHSNLNTLYTNLNKDLQILNDWFKTNKLSLNVSKTQYMIFNKKKQRAQDAELNIIIGQENVNQVKYTKFLGIYIDENLDWSKHIQQCKCKIASGNYAINVSKNVLSPAHSKTLYYSLVYPYLNYGILLWGNTYKKFLHKLEISQKKPIRTINRAMYNEPSSPLFKKCNIIKLQDIYKLQCCKLMYEFLKNNLPTPIMNIFTVNSDVHGHNTRQLNDVHLPKVKTDIVKRSYLCKAPVYWSQLSNNVKSSKTNNIFKRHLTNNLLSQY